MDIRLDAEDRAAHRRQGRAVRSVLARYSRFVGLMKVMLPAIAAALLGLVVVWPKLAPRDSAFRDAFAGFNMKTVDTLSMQNPRYYGTDNKNLPFAVTATLATQVDQQNMVVSLENPTADFTQKNGSGVILSADVGFFRQKEQILDLIGHVDLYQDTGYEVHTNSARIEVAKGNASGDEPTKGHGPAGSIEGEGFRLWERGRSIIFTGKAKAVLTMAKSATKAKPARKPKS